MLVNDVDRALYEAIWPINDKSPQQIGAQRRRATSGSQMLTDFNLEAR